MNDIEKAIAYWKEFKAEIPELKQDHMEFESDLIEQEMFVDLAISALEHQLTNEWIPVSEQLPEDSRLVLAYLNCGTYDVTFHRYNGKWYGDCDDGRVTHWMPLPGKPKESD